MSNELIWFIFMLIDFGFLLFAFRFFGKTGLYCVIVANIILCNIQVTKIVSLFGMTATLGNILYGSIFLATDILSEFYGKKEARKGVLIGFLALIMMTIYMQITLVFKPDPSDFASEHLKIIFDFMPRIALGSIIAYLLSQLHDVWAFQFWKIKTKGKHLWIRNNMSTLVSQIIDTSIFCFIAFWGVYENEVWLQIFFTTYILKVIVSFLDTPFLYLAKNIYKNVEV